MFPALKAVRGHNMAKAAVEMAVWDLFARQRGVPLARLLGGTRDRIASGVSLGIQDVARRAGRARSSGELADGYRKIKIKIKPGWDVRRGGAAARALRRHPAHGRRELGLSRSATPITWPSSTPSI